MLMQSAKQIVRIVRRPGDIWRRVSRMFDADAAKLLYTYGDGDGGYAMWAGTADDCALIVRAAKLPGCPRPLRVVCENGSLRSQLGRDGMELLSLEDFARQGIPILVLPTAGGDEVSLEKKLRKIALEIGHSFSPFDCYSASRTTTKHTVRRYRDVELDILPSVLWPTLYSNWEYINFLIKDLKGRHDLDVLDMFAGSGVVGFCLLKEAGIRSISFCDVNYWAIRSMRMTVARRHDLKAEGIYLSEGLAQVPSSAKFDLIVGNPPHADRSLDGPDWLPGSDPKWEAHHLFFRDAYKHLRSDGRIIFIESASSGIEQEFYAGLPDKYPQYRLGRRIVLRNNICYLREVLVA
ncbi:MAG TPA: methyltransferase [Xanthobacteraceae bacterium]|nr:methyltransferase [Xanthobacteraceae bacterium]